MNRSSDATRPVEDESPRPRPQRAEQPPHGRRWVPAPNGVCIGDQIDVQSSMEELDWLREQGVVMQSARGPVPSLAERVAGGPIRGSWWGHPSGHEIYRVLREVRASPDVVAMRLIDGKVTLMHRRLWPALVRVADRFETERLAAIDEVHTGSGAHRTIAISFPDWVPAEDSTAADLLTVGEALAQLPTCLR